MAEQADSTLRTCKHCQTEKPLDDFTIDHGRRTHRCRECTKHVWREKYANCEGQYANRKSPEWKAKRRAEYLKRRAAANEDLSALRVCKHCGEEKTLDKFCTVGGWKTFKCRECRAAERRKAYRDRQGEFSKRDTPVEKEKRRQRARSSIGRYIWEPDWWGRLGNIECSRCHISLPANPAWFRLNTTRPVGLSSWCRSCEARHYDENRLKRNEGQRRYWRRRMENEPEKIKANRLNWQRKNHEKKRWHEQEWRNQNIERFRHNNRAKENRRRARKANAGGSFSADDIDAMRAAQKGRCWYCSKPLKKYHVEHRIPLSRGGSNDPSNLVLACPPCNLSKGSKMPWEMEAGRLL